MAKVTIIFEDEPDGAVNMKFESDPPFSEYADMNQPYSNAQGLGYSTMELVTKLIKEKQNG